MPPCSRLSLLIKNPLAKKLYLLLLPVMLLASCHELNDDRIPMVGVNIDLGNAGVWATYGVSGYGPHREFILADGIRLPAGFPYTVYSKTGYGGVLLIGGFNPFTGEIGPMAFDLSCPVERKPDVRVYIDEETFDAICPVCGSHYNVVGSYGAPLTDPAKAFNYALTPYRCVPIFSANVITGYVIQR